MRWGAILLALAGSVAGAAQAEEPADPLSWLGRVVTAGRKLSYSGSFVYQSGSHTETWRITHLVDAGGAHEKLEALDGSPREVVRTKGEVKCFIPGERVVIVEREAQRKSFPSALPDALDLDRVTQFYTLRKGDVGRVAGLDSQLLILEPKDRYRYGHMLWADVNTGLLLKSRIVNDKNELIEQRAFTQVQIGGNIGRDAVKSKLAQQATNWRVENAEAVTASAADSAWIFRTEVPGFKKISEMKRQPRRDSPEVMHFVFSDGMARISAFIEPLKSSDRPAEGFFSSGVVNGYKRVEGGHLLVLVGEVPPQTLKMLGDGVEPRR